MNYYDANVILRYLLSDNEALYARALTILDNEQVFVPNEVLAEVVYVSTTIRLDDDILLFLKKRAKEEHVPYQALINQYLRNYVQHVVGSTTTAV